MSDSSVIPVAHPWQHQRCQPDKVAVIIADTGETLTYGEMMERAGRCASLLGELGCATGDTIAILAENNAAYAELCWAAKNSGLFYACVSTQLNLEDARYVVADCDARVLIASETMRPLATEVAAQLAGQVRLLIVGGDTRSADSYEAMRDRSPAAPAAMQYGAHRCSTRPEPQDDRRAFARHCLTVPPTTPPTRHAFLVSAFGFSSRPYSSTLGLSITPRRCA